MSDSLLDQTLKAMNATGLTSNAFTQENKQPVVPEQKPEQHEVVTIEPEKN